MLLFFLSLHPVFHVLLLVLFQRHNDVPSEVPVSGRRVLAQACDSRAVSERPKEWSDSMPQAPGVPRPLLSSLRPLLDPSLHSSAQTALENGPGLLPDIEVCRLYS